MSRRVVLSIYALNCVRVHQTSQFALGDLEYPLHFIDLFNKLNQAYRWDDITCSIRILRYFLMMNPFKKKKKRQQFIVSQLFLRWFELTLPSLRTLLALCQLGYLCNQRSWGNWNFNSHPQVTGWFQSLFGTWVCKCLYRYKGENRRWPATSVKGWWHISKAFPKIKANAQEKG